MWHRGGYRAGASGDPADWVGSVGRVRLRKYTGRAADLAQVRQALGAGTNRARAMTRQPASEVCISVGPVGPSCPFRGSRHIVAYAPHASPAPRHAGPRKCQRARLTCGHPFTECMGGVMEIDCRRCEMRGAGCQDCVVTFLELRNVGGFSAAVPSHLGEAELRALGVLAAAGMVPPLRLALPGSTVLPGARAWTPQVFPAAKAS